MNTRRNPALRAVLDELDAVGASYTIVRNRHVKVYWELHSFKGVTVVSLTSGDFAPVKARAEIRKQLRAMTINRTEPATA